MWIGAPWSGLPWEIRQSILMVVVRDKHPGWASLASVCTEWQSVIETENLRRITLDEDNIKGLQKNITKERRNRVRHIHLNVRLLPYECDRCREEEDTIEMGVNTGFVIGPLYKLLKVLSTWPERQPGKGLKLELNAYSDSDCLHWYRHYYYGAPVQTWRSLIPLHDPHHGWTSGQRTETGLPTPAPVVTSFVIRRSFRRCILPSVLTKILQMMPCLEELIYEPWRTWYYAYDVLFHLDPDLVLDIDAPVTTIRKLVIFEHTNDELSVALNELPGYGNFQTQVIPIITGAFAWASTVYEEIWVSLLFDAKVFFSCCFENYTWWHLRSLCLTSPALNSGSPAEAAALLHDAARVAMRMPMLHTLVLWNGEEQGQACAFIYRASSTGPSITWRGTWDIGLYLTSVIVDAWKAVVSQTGWEDICVCSEPVKEEIRFLGDAIYYLRLPCQVIEPQSLWEMRREERMIVPSSLTEVE
ncbi:hypothetical protein M419DRAFT_11582 [Trichoderma reesei RUT C-30]|uniref:DUF6546 domain-containing protein n=1 Tax=Hypocrea jecorina (strain ATCC 56765 / BCRC 32924 / NRRL 11460 / Rut C-30) TaxID=1344414 RepID=A0A024S2Z6_HYPJR|nr:hypothetical protein M419DRAFT_11582 [Trichoderma reesei RUT C-30]